ncbi:MAG TPA: preprotein translocase subunit SecG [Xanthobacteraceae bacterium]|nr:preprotein translocase subunit SecG [Xanthobacteraceae bacterium]
MQTVIILIHLMIVIVMVGLVLLQRSEGGGLGMGGGAGFMSSRGTANVLTRATAILAGLFFATSLVLSILAGFERKPATLINGPAAPTSQPLPGAPAPLGTPPGAPSGAPSGAPGQPAPVGPGNQPPTGPQVPRSQ